MEWWLTPEKCLETLLPPRETSRRPGGTTGEHEAAFLIFTPPSTTQIVVPIPPVWHGGLSG